MPDASGGAVSIRPAATAADSAAFGALLADYVAWCRARDAVDDSNDRTIGGGAWHRLPDGSCEMKRVFVAAHLRGRGVGRRLCQALIDEARAAGFALIRLDTLHRFTEAIALYASLGFRRCAPHHVYPADIAGLFVFMELRLDERRQGD